MPLVQLIILLAGFLIALSVHEAAHAYLADKLGDPNPRLAGRLSLNPLAHIDPLGTILLPLFLIISGSPIVFGWAKPVEIDVFNLKNSRRDSGLISLAGPAANLLLAIIFSFGLRFMSLPLNYFSALINLALFSLISTNLALAIFNLLPIHPLDGGKVLVGFLPPEAAIKTDEFLHQYGQIILLLMIFPFFGRSLISLIIGPIINALFSLLIPSALLI